MHRTFTWSPPTKGATDSSTVRRLFPTECTDVAASVVIDSSRDQPTNDHDAAVEFGAIEGEIDGKDSCIVKRVDDLFTKILKNGCDPRI